MSTIPRPLGLLWVSSVGFLACAEIAETPTALGGERIGPTGSAAAHISGHPEPLLAWVNQFGTAAGDLAVAASAAPHGIYVVGETSGQLPGQISGGGVDAFVRKYAPTGDILWTRQFGGAGQDRAAAVAVDPTGVYVVGHVLGDLPGETGPGNVDAFVRKYSPAGDVMWTEQFGSSSSDYGLGVAADASGVYVVGSTLGSLPEHTTAGSDDAFVRRFDGSGTELWTRQFGTTTGDVGYAAAVDVSGVYVAGFTGAAFPGFTTAGQDDAFVRKYGADGEVVWTRQFGTPADDHLRAALTTSTGLYVVGFVEDQPTNVADVVVAQLRSADGGVLWTRQLGTPGRDYGLAAAGSEAGVLVGGYTSGVFPGQMTHGGIDAFLLEFDATGNVIWTRQFGTGDRDAAPGVAAGADGIFAAGYTEGVFADETSAGSFDAFLARFASADQQIQDLLDAVTALGEAGSLNRGQVRSLHAKLDAARARLEAGNTSAARALLNAFIAEVEALVRGGTLSTSEGATLIEAAEALLAESGG